MLSLALESVLVADYAATFNHAIHLSIHRERVISREARTSRNTEVLQCS